MARLAKVQNSFTGELLKYYLFIYLLDQRRSARNREEDAWRFADFQLVRVLIRNTSSLRHMKGPR